MHILLEAINRGILRGLNENNIELLADLDDENLDLADSILAKSVNNHYDAICRHLQSSIMRRNITSELKQLINDPANFDRFKGLIKANDKKHLKELIKIGLKLFGGDGNFNWIDTSDITNMSTLFKNNANFNGHIELWDVSNVINMKYMFCEAKKFNLPIGDWDVSNVTNMRGMFYHAEKFNKPIGKWNVSNVTNMEYMFYFANEFNQQIGNWDVSSVTNMGGMFNGAKKFNLPIGDWDVSNVTTMNGMFHGAISFNQPLNNWVIKGNVNTDVMFGDCPIKEEYKPQFIK